MYAGHLDVYEKGAEILGKFLRVKPHTTRAYRVTRDLGAAIEESLYSVVVPTTVPEQQTVYAMLDGSMIFTDNQWREVKLGRLFAAGAIVQAGSAQAQRDRGRSITDSEYVACLGGHEEFTRRFSRLIEQHRDRGKDLVFVNDGAAWIWIWTWITENYPEATQILDFYHAAEYLGGFARVCYDSEEQSRSWRAGQKALQLAGQFDRVVSAIRRSACRRSKAVRNEADRVLRYFRTHRDRMHYDEYIRWGLMIGSGAVESAHRTVVQARMKLSGQRWTNDGASDMLNLRVASLGCRWDELVVGHIRRAARAE